MLREARQTRTPSSVWPRSDKHMGRCGFGYTPCRAQGRDPGLPMPGIETIKMYLLSAAFLLPDAQDTCSNVTSKCSRQIMLGYLHSSHAAPWGKLRGTRVRLWVRDGVRAHMLSPVPQICSEMLPIALHGTLPRLQPEKKLVIYSLKPNQPPHQLDGGKDLLLLILHEAMALSTLLGTGAPLQTRER